MLSAEMEDSFGLSVYSLPEYTSRHRFQLEDLYRQLRPDQNPTFMPGWMDEILEAQHQALIVADAHTPMRVKAVGMGIITLSSGLEYRTALLNTLVVDLDYRRQGIGTEILKCSAATAASMGATALQFTARDSREDALSFYASMGMHPEEDKNIFLVRLPFKTPGAP